MSLTAGSATFERSYPAAGLEEDRVGSDVETWLGEPGRAAALGRNARDILRYATTEWVNNAVEHSGSDAVRVRVLVDELLRVWARAHPATRLVPTSMNEPVEFMVRRGLGDVVPPAGG